MITSVFARACSIRGIEKTVVAVPIHRLMKTSYLYPVESASVLQSGLNMLDTARLVPLIMPACVADRPSDL